MSCAAMPSVLNKTSSSAAAQWYHHRDHCGTSILLKLDTLGVCCCRGHGRGHAGADAWGGLVSGTGVAQLPWLVPPTQQLLLEELGRQPHTSQPHAWHVQCKQQGYDKVRQPTWTHTSHPDRQHPEPPTAVFSQPVHVHDVSNYTASFEQTPGAHVCSPLNAAYMDSVTWWRGKPGPESHNNSICMFESDSSE
jgi:hypothetical protein